MIEKTVYEEIFRTCEFKRPDGQGWLNDLETITTCEVKCYEAGVGTDVSATMLSDVAVYNTTQVKYKLKAGEAGKQYYLKVRATTSNGQKMEAVFQMKVV